MTTLGNKKQLQERAAQVIPGGMYGHQSIKFLTDDFPQFYARAQGAYLWDVDGHRYIDYLCAYGPNLFGYGHPQIEAAAARQQALGDTMTGPTALMVELAEEWVKQVKHADWAMFARNGADANNIALVTARAYKGRRKVLLATGAYHGAATWNTPAPAGITPEDRAHIVYFDYNDVDSLEAAVKSVAGDVAAIYATPFRHEVLHDQFLPSAAYARAVRRLCDEQDALMVVDEVRTGLRLSRTGSWDHFDVQPDLSCWGKTIGGGHAIAMLLGNDKARQAAQDIFVTGSFWYSATPMAAALETLKLVRSTDYLEHTHRIGDALRAGIAEQALRHGFVLKQTGPSVMPQMLFDGDNATLTLGRTWTSETVKRGAFLHPYHNMFMCAAMTDADVAHTLQATEDAFKVLKATVKLPLAA